LYWYGDVCGGGSARVPYVKVNVKCEVSEYNREKEERRKGERMDEEKSTFFEILVVR
jgi:hypothetical protein